MVSLAVNTGLVRQEEIRVAELAGGRLLLHLPKGLRVDSFIKALLASFWSQGFSAQPWSQLDGTEVVMPRFKLLVDLEDFPIYLWRERILHESLAGIGLYLGSVPPAKRSNRTLLRVAIATNDLRKVPRKIGLVGGIKHIVKLRPVA